MKKFLLFLTAITITHFVSAQNACSNQEKTKQIRISSDSQHSSTLSQIELYWSKYCLCESGAITGGTWDYTVEIANRVYDKYKQGRYTNNYTGPSYPAPSKRLSVSDCKNGNNLNITPDISDCAQTSFDNDTDPQQYGNAFMAARCECQKGVASEERAKQLEIQMTTNAKNAKEFYKTPLNLPSSLKAADCPILEPGAGGAGGGQADVVDYNKGKLVQDEYLNLLNDIAADSKNLHFKTMVEEMNENRNDFAQGRNLAMQFGGLSQQDMDMYNMFENISQGIAIGKFLFNTLTKALTPEQKAARDYIQELYSELNTIHKEVSYIPTFYAYDDKVLPYLNNKEQLINQYEQATAMRRLLYLEYWLSEPYMTIGQLQQKAQELQALQTSNGTPYLIQLIDQKELAFHAKEFVCITNKEYGFNQTFTRIKMNEANYYEANGNIAKADEIRKSINYNANNFEAFKLLEESYKTKDYFGSLQYYEQVKEILRINENGGDFFLFYKNIPNITYNHDGLWRHEATYLLALGVLSHAAAGNLSQAQAELDFIKWFNENHRKFNEDYALKNTRKKAGTFSDIDYKISYGQCLAIEKTLDAILSSKNGKHKEALALLEEATTLIKENASSEKSYDYWIKQANLDAQIRAENFLEAKKSAMYLNKMSYVAKALPNIKLFSLHDLKYSLAFMKFKQQQYQSCINQVEILEAAFPKSLRLKALKLDAYKELGDVESANELETVINQINN